MCHNHITHTHEPPSFTVSSSHFTLSSPKMQISTRPSFLLFFFFFFFFFNSLVHSSSSVQGIHHTCRVNACLILLCSTLNSKLSFMFCVSTILDFQPLPAPISGSDYNYEPHLSPPALPPVPAGGGGSDSLSGESVPPSLAVIGKRQHGSPEAPVKDNGGAWWCSVREEVEECRFFVSVINQLTGNSWKWLTLKNYILFTYGFNFLAHYC